MTTEGGETAAPRNAAEALEAIGVRLRDSGGDLVPGASLILVTFCRRHGILLDDEALVRLSVFFGLDHDEMGRIVAFHDQALEPQSGCGDPVTLCLGASCSLHGAETLHRQIRAGFEKQGISREFAEVFCLGQCEFGPSIMVERSIYCGREQKVVSDEREWRSEDSGPVSLEDDSVPVRD